MNFNNRCYSILKKVPCGKVVSYKDIAKAIGTNAYRAVGNAMHQNKSPIIIPCHRVIKSNGEIGGYAYGVKKKIGLLKKEGVEVINNRIDLKKYWYKF